MGVSLEVVLSVHGISTLYERAVKVLARLRGCADSAEPSLVALNHGDGPYMFYTALLNSLL